MHKNISQTSLKAELCSLVQMTRLNQMIESSKIQGGVPKAAVNKLQN